MLGDGVRNWVGKWPQNIDGIPIRYFEGNLEGGTIFYTKIWLHQLCRSGKLASVVLETSDVIDVINLVDTTKCSSIFPLTQYHKNEPLYPRIVFI